MKNVLDVGIVQTGSTPLKVQLCSFYTNKEMKQHLHVRS